jgi:hypothetical protein
VSEWVGGGERMRGSSLGREFIREGVREGVSESPWPMS